MTPRLRALLERERLARFAADVGEPLEQELEVVPDDPPGMDPDEFKRRRDEQLERLDVAARAEARRAAAGDGS